MSVDDDASSRIPALAVCGSSGAGKTTLLERAIPPLVRSGLRVAVVKHDAHGVDVDRPGKDSDRLFRAGATVLLDGPGESLERRHGPEDDLTTRVDELGRDHDLVLVEGHKTSPVDKVWLLSEDEEAPPAGLASVLDVLPWGCDRAGRFVDLARGWLDRQWRGRLVLGGILVGGRSRRMGRPKQTLEVGGAALLDRVAGVLDAACDRVVLLGEGPVTEAAAALPRLPDPPRLAGPMAGLAGALRWAPGAAWVICSCDLPRLGEASVRWVLGQRAPGRWGVLPRTSDGEIQPLAAVYEPQAASLVERALAEHRWGPRHLAGHPAVHCPEVPADLTGHWVNVNSPADLRRLEG